MILPCKCVTSRRTSGVHLGPSSCVSLGPSASCCGPLLMVDWFPSLLPASPPADDRKQHGQVTSRVSVSTWSSYHQDVVQVLCLPPIILNLLMNAFVHLYLAFYVVFINLKTLYLSITFKLIYILEAQCTPTGDPCYIILYCILLYFLNNYFNHLFNFIL